MFKRTLVILTAFVCFASPEPREASAIEVDSRISAVTVYSDRALVKREFSVELPEGFASLNIPGLPAKMLNESVRVSGKVSSGAIISGVNIDEEYLETSAQDAVRDLQERVRKIEEQKRILTDRKGVLERKKGFIESLSDKTVQSISEKIAVQRPSVEEWIAMVSFVDESLDEINKEAQSIDNQLIDLDRKKEVLGRELADYQNPASESRKNVRVDLEMADPGNVSLELSYIVMGADWTPIYDIRASSDNDTISVVFMANVKQNTGEDWTDVQLELSTAKPFLGGIPSLLDPWYLRIAELGSFRAGHDGDLSYMLDENEKKKIVARQKGPFNAPLTQVTDAELAVADVSQQLISTTFVLRQSESIQSDNIPKKVSVKIASTVGKKEHYAVPKLNTYAYLRSKVSNSTNFPLLPGKANVFFDGSFVSTTYIPLVAPSEGFEMYLGIDEGIKLERELVEKFADQTGVMSKKNRVEYSYKITVETYRDFQQKITLLDQIPVSQDDRLEIKLKKVAPDPLYKDDDETKGILRWVLDLEPGEKEEITFNYEIKYPSGVLVEGLN